MWDQTRPINANVILSEAKNQKSLVTSTLNPANLPSVFERRPWERLNFHSLDFSSGLSQC